ncbi:MAG: MoaD/ThiS family protein [Nitrospiraceae bacterium]
MVTVIVIGQLQQHMPEPEYPVELTAPTTVKTLLEGHEDLFLPLRPFLSSSQLMVTVNKKIGTLDSVVKDGDTVKLTYSANFSYEGARWQNP